MALAIGLGLGLGLAGRACAQFESAAQPQAVNLQPSAATSEADYRLEAARHLYNRYPQRIFKGRLPPGLYGVAVVETELGPQGQVLAVRVRRAPAAPELLPWIEQMVHRAAPFPPPLSLGQVRYLDIWLVDQGGNFQLDALTEGQD